MLHFAEPWMSDIDIPAGANWSLEVGSKLTESAFGIICVTRDNLDAPWVLFEAGALANSFGAGLVCPYLLDVEYRELVGPLSQFQAKKAERGPTLELLQALNQRSTTPISDDHLNEMFDAFWPKLEAALADIPPSKTTYSKPRSTDEILESLASGLMSIDSRLEGLQTSLIRPGSSVVQLTLPKTMQGVVSVLNNERGFGFIHTSEGTVYLHASEMTDGLKMKELRVGDEVEFEFVLEPRGARAKNVRRYVPEGS